MDKNIFRKNNSEILSKIEFYNKNGSLLASFALDSKISHEVLSLLIAEAVKNMIVEGA